MSPRVFSRRPLLVAAVAACVGAGLAAPAFVTSANAVSTAPATIVVDSVTSATQPPGGTPAGSVPSVIVAAGQTFTINVHFLDSTGAPTSFTNDTRLAITSSKGSLTVTNAIAPGKSLTASLTASLGAAVNQVKVTVDGSGGDAKKITEGSSGLFDVLKSIQFNDSPANIPFQQGIGGTSGCAEATTTDPVCGLLVLPNGAASSQVLLSLGACDAYANCNAKGSFVQLLADTGTLYSKTTPATLIVKCDKSLCGTGAIQSKQLNFSLSAQGPLDVVAPSCPAKKTIGADQTACVDYVQSTRDNAGDTILYFLFTADLRVSGH